MSSTENRVPSPEATVEAVLRAARARIDHPSKWCRYWSVSADYKRLCAAEAIREAAGWTFENEPPPENIVALSEAALLAFANETGINPLWEPYQRVSYFNDGSKHRGVMAAFDRAIAKARGQAVPA